MTFSHNNIAFAVAKGKSNHMSPQVWNADPEMTTVLPGKGQQK